MSILNYHISWARIVSDIFSPPMVWAALAFPIAFRDAPAQRYALGWAAVYIILVCLVPVLYIATMVKMGKITDIHMQVRQQRMLPFMVSMVCTGAAWLTLRFVGAPSVLPLFALFSFIQLAIMAAITLWWQISIHAVSITGVTVATGALFGVAPALLTMPLIVLVGAARLKLKRHTPMQVVAGTLVGAVIPVLLFIFIAVP